MRRTALVALVPAVVIAATWLRLEEPRDDPNRVAAVVVLALGPAFVRPRSGRIIALVLSVCVGARIAFGWWGHPIRVAAAFKNGFLDFYDVQVPFDPRVHAEMRSVILDTSALRRGTYKLTLSVSKPGEPAVTSERRLVLR